MYSSTVEFVSNLPSPKVIGPDHLVVIDKYLVDKQPFMKWIKSFEHVYVVEAGETLKDTSHLVKHLQAIFNIKSNINRSTKVVAVGGGSVGDFTGFIASITKRGLCYEVIPTTWLAILDSAHGGKNGLNFKGIKNQIGTVYQPQKVYVVDAVIDSLNLERLCEARGEIIKSAFLLNEKIYRALSVADAHDLLAVKKYLKALIRMKYKVVEQDPYEKKAIRFQLNLGHTVGHAIEAQLKIPHGLAVLFGLYFSFTWSHHLGKISNKRYIQFKDYFFRDVEKLNVSRLFLKAFSISQVQLNKFLLQDKKRASENLLNFVFPIQPGQTEILKVYVKDILSEYLRQTKIVKGQFQSDVSIQG